MQIKWIIECDSPEQVRGHIAFDESGRYQIIYDYNDGKYCLYDHKPKMVGVPNPNLLDWINIKDLSYMNIVTLSDVLIMMHRKIENYNCHKCGNCRHLIFKDYKHNEGLCRLTRLNRCFTDICVHEEEMS